MRKRWYVLAALAGSLAAAIVWQWPARPTWRSGPDAGWLQGFSPDGQIVVTARVPPQTADGYPDPEVCRFDAATGKLLSRVVFPCADPYKAKAVRPSLDGRLAAVGEGASMAPNDGPGDWYIHDALTGQRRLGPIRGLTMLAPHFSPDGRWLWGKGATQASNRIVIFSTTTGKLVSVPARQNGLATEECFFAPDALSVAVHHQLLVRGLPRPPDMVQVFELPSGQELYSLDLPKRKWDLYATRWDGRFLQTLEVLDSDLPGPFTLRRYVFDLSKDPVGEGVEEQLVNGEASGDVEHLGYLDAGPDWVAYFTLD